MSLSFSLGFGKLPSGGRLGGVRCRGDGGCALWADCRDAACGCKLVISMPGMRCAESARLRGLSWQVRLPARTTPCSSDAAISAAGVFHPSRG